LQNRDNPPQKKQRVAEKCLANEKVMLDFFPISLASQNSVDNAALFLSAVNFLLIHGGRYVMPLIFPVEYWGVAPSESSDKGSL
jgi:hypothetical protein